MSNTLPKEGASSDSRRMHYSVGAVIEQDGKFLLMDRVNPPYGYAGPAGHVDEGESPEQALRREVQEETGYNVLGYELLFSEEIPRNSCKRGIEVHMWFLYRCKVSGELRRSDEEAKAMDWFSSEDMISLRLEPVWKYWFGKLGVV